MTLLPPPIDIHRVAAEAGVSIATVSRALNNPNRVNAKTRSHVLEVIERLGYRPNAVARGLVTGRTHIVGLVIPDVEGPLYSAMARGLEDVLSPQGLHAMIASSDRDETRELEAIGTLLDRQVDGLIVVGSGLSEATLNLLERAQLPWVLMEPERQHLERLGAVNVVALDNHTGGRLALEHLLERGCTRRAAARALNDPPNQYGFVNATDPSQPYFQQVFEYFAMSNGVKLTDKNGKVTLNTNAMRQTLQFYKELTGFVNLIQGPQGLEGASYGQVQYLGITRDANTAQAKTFVKYWMGDGYLSWLGIAAEGMVTLNDQETPRQYLMAGAVLVTMPVMFLFFAFERYLVGGLTAGGVKG
ncbi:MAG: LacI family DNA-binding transcriptional regulator [Pleurocapsa sp. SU_196_0]|nr:LacI family DNA-binding transcriptional regulator [Pleurocapsa sp. SU_196_0]